MLRIDPALWRELEVWARNESRSVNGQIEYLLHSAIQHRKGGERTPEQGQPTAEREP